MEATITKSPVMLYTEETPNPEALKYVTNRMLYRGIADFNEKELAAAQESLNQATARLQEKIERARSGRRLLTAILAAVIFMAGMMTVGIAASASETMSYIHVAVWMTALVVIPTFVYRKIKLPQSSRSEVEGAEAKIAKIRAQIAAARAVVDSVH